MRIRLPNELLLINALTILLIIIITFTSPNVLRIILGLPFVLFFPGYTFIAALFPSRDALGSIERVALSFGLSIIVVPLIVFILNYTPWGIGLYPVFVSVTIFILATSVVAWRRRRRFARVESFNVSLNLSLAFWKGQRFVDKVLTIVLMVVILGATGTVIYAIATPRGGERSTEFYITGLEGEAIDYPSDLKVGEKGKVIVRVTNYEKVEASYRVEVRIDGMKNNEVGPIVLGNEQKWEEIISFTADRAGDNQKVEFFLYKNEETAPYLNPLHLWVNVKDQR